MLVVTYAKTNYAGETGYVKETREPSKQSTECSPMPKKSHNVQKVSVPFPELK